MADLAQALSEIKSLPDSALQKELASPSGMLPGYLVLGEMHERKRLRAESHGQAPTKRPSMAEEYMGNAQRAFAGAGLAGQTRPIEPPPQMAQQAPPPPQGGIGSLQPQVQGYARGGIVSLDNNFRQRLIETADSIGANPVDLATAISYESGFNPNVWGGSGGNYYGLIQFGPNERKQYGVDTNNVDSQLGANGAIAKYMRDRGFKPGMSGMDLYSTINAGSPGRYGASDTAAGGAPGDVRDKWENQMAAHRAKAEALLGSGYSVDPNATAQIAATNATNATAQTAANTASNMAAAETAGDAGGDAMSLLMLSQMLGGQQKQAAPPPPPVQPKVAAYDPNAFYRRRSLG
jgi:hypothetical protein